MQHPRRLVLQPWASIGVMLLAVACSPLPSEPTPAAIVPAPSPAAQASRGSPSPEGYTPGPPITSPTPPGDGAVVRVPLVPVTGFWSKERSITRADLQLAIEGRTSPTRRVLVSAADLVALADALGVVPGPNVSAVEPGQLRSEILRSTRTLGLVRASDVSPELRALAVDGVTLFGEARVRDLGAWPLLIAEAAGPRTPGFDPATTWTLVAGGDVMLDRAAYASAVIGARGVDSPWDGGTARIHGRSCCGAPGLRIVDPRPTGRAGAVRALLRGADVTVVNLEGPAPDRFTYHPHGLVFTMDPGLLPGLRNAGVDVVSLANNHILDAGARGVADTTRNLEELGIRHAGAGRTAAAARSPAWLDAGGLRVAVLAATAIAPGRSTARSAAGVARLHVRSLRADIASARRAGADLVIVVPHWGHEYTDAISHAQRRMARAIVAAGADLVLGSHSHWAGPIELIDGKLVVYSLGDLVFDLTHDERTQEGVIVELSFVGERLAQVELHPTVIVSGTQPNLLEPSGGGDRLLRAIRAASE